MWLNAISIGIGGALGALLRFLIGTLVSQWALFPFHTFFANALGCFLIGILMVLLEPLSDAYEFVRLGILTGFLGSLTTFSTFSYEIISLSKQEKFTLGVLYLVSSILIGLLLCYLGIYLARGVLK